MASGGGAAGKPWLVAAVDICRVIGRDRARFRAKDPRVPADRHGMRNRLWLLYLAGVAIAAAAYFTSGETAAALIFPVFGLSTATAVAYGARARGDERRGWLYVGGAIGLLAVGDIAYAVHAWAAGSVPVPSEVDAFYLLAYVALALALKSLTGRHGVGVALEAAIVSVGVFLVAWTFVLRGGIDNGTAAPLEVATAVAYPVADLVVLTLLVRVLFSGRAVGRQIVALLAGAAALVAGDLLYATALFGGGYEKGSVVDVFWIAAYALWGAGSLLPDRALMRRLPALRPRMSPLRVVLLCASVVGANALLAFGHTEAVYDRVVLVTGTAAIALLALARAWDLTRSQETLLDEARGAHDRLNGLLGAVGAIVSEYDLTARRMTHLAGDVEGLTGYPREAFLAESELWRQSVPLEDQERIDALRAKAVADGIGFTADYPFRRRDGAVAWLRVTATPDMAARRVRSVTVDVTAQRDAEEQVRRTEERFRSLIENGSDVISLLALDGTFLYVSPSFERILGWEQGEIVGHSAFEFIHPDDVDAVAERFREGLARRSGAWATTSDFRFRAADGSWRRFESVAQVREDAGGEPVVVVNSRDVTERRELEEQLRHAQKLEAIGRLAGGVAHDFNNLLTGIGGYAELLLASLDDADPRRADAFEIQRAAQRAAMLTSQLLAFGRRQVLQPEVLDVAGVVSGLENLLARLLGADVELRTAADRGCFAYVDRGQLEQVITNLAVNARDAMPGGGTLAIETRRRESERGVHVELTVTDTGIGMDEETVERAFEPFFTTKEEGKGTGLGLSTVFGIVTQSGGTVGVSSRPELGTTVTVTLPAAESEGAAADDPVAAPAEGRSGGETILLVEDEDMIRRLVRDVLTRSGYTVLDAPAADPALDLLRAHDGIDLLLTDVVMPGMSGPALAKIATSERPSLRVLFTSGYTNQPEDIFDDPSAAFIGKPFSPQALVAKVREVLELRDVPA